MEKNLKLYKEDSRFIFIHHKILTVVLNQTYSKAEWSQQLQRFFDEVTITPVESNLFIAKCTFAHASLSYALFELEGPTEELCATHFELHQ